MAEHGIYHRRHRSSRKARPLPCSDSCAPPAPEKHHATIDVIFAVLLPIATPVTAVCVYQATPYGESARYRSESIKASPMANSGELVGVPVFLDRATAVSQGDLRQKAFIEERFRPAFEAWRVGAGAANPIPPGTPFSLPAYALAKNNESALLEAKAAAAFSSGQDANDNGDLYISYTILFSIVMFFCGIYSRWEELRIRQGLLVVTLIVFALGLYSMGSLLIRVGYI